MVESRVVGIQGWWGIGVAGLRGGRGQGVVGV